jgi:nucleoside-diphosphate-sugar epimerase
MRCVVVGGLGFIGSAIVRELSRRGDEVVTVDRRTDERTPHVRYGNMNTGRGLVKVFAGAEEVYHLAGMLGTAELDSNIDQVRRAIEANITGAVNVFDAAERAGVKRVFYPSKPHPWLNTYTITKLAGESFARLWNQRGKLTVTSLRFFNVFGPRQHICPVRKMIPAFAVQAILHLPLEIFGDGEQTVDLIHVDDAAALAVHATRAGLEVVHDCGRGVPVSVNQAARMVNDIVGNNAGIRHLPMRPGETPRTELVANMAGSRFAGFAFKKFEPSVRETVAWYQALPREDLLSAASFYGWEVP